MPNNHRKPMSTTERSFWREAFLIAPYSFRARLSDEIDEIVKLKANFADAAVAEYRLRVTWRNGR